MKINRTSNNSYVSEIDTESTICKAITDRGYGSAEILKALEDG